MVDLVIDSRRRDLGGFEVGRVLPFAQRRMVGPFVFFDHMGPLTFPANVPRSTDIRPHPHIGLSTVTYLFDGEITHRDSLGAEQVIRPGEMNWMTAGRGISHSERFEGMRAHGGPMHGIQAWIGLPQDQEETDPAFDHYAMEQLPMLAEPGVEARLIVGSAFGETSPVKTHSPTFYIHADMAKDTSIGLPATYSERAAFVASGKIEVDGRGYRDGQMLVFAAGETPRIKATEPATVMLLGGEPIGPRHVWWNFVSSSRERIEQAKADWKAGRFKLPIHDTKDFIPLPDEPKPPAEPMS